MIVLLNGHSLEAKDRFMPEKMGLNLSERQSTATITVGPTAPEIGVDDWLRDESEPGAGIIWRVKSVDTSYETETRTINCEHVINTLKDRIMFGEHTAAKITGNKKATSCTAAQAIRYALRFQDDWTLNEFSYGRSAEYSFNGDDVFSAIETVSGSLTDPWWSYDLTRYPFRLNITDRSTAVGCEMRMDRNIRTLRKTVDRSRMYTRFYPIGENNLHLDDDFVSKNTSLYGVVSKVETDGSKKTKSALRSWAEDRLRRHSEPSVTVTISGLELSAATGEPLDKLTLGTKCQVPLPEFGTTITEWITKLSWSDKIADPESVTVTLANTMEDVASIVNKLQKSTSSGGRKAAKKNEEDHAWFVDTTEHVGMVAEAVAGPGADQDWSRVASIFVDGEGIHQKVVRAEHDIVVAQTAIEANEDAIELEATRREAGDSDLSGKLRVQADKIEAEVTERENGQIKLQSKITANTTLIQNEVTRATDEDSALSGRLTVMADMVSMSVGSKDTRQILYFPNYYRFPATGSTSYRYYDCGNNKYYEWKNGAYRQIPADNYIKAGEIVTAINEDGTSSTHIDADKVYIGNTKSTTVINGKCELSDVTANYISAKLATLDLVEVKRLSTTNDIAAGSLYGRNIYISGATAQSDPFNVKNFIKEVQISGPTNNSYKLQYKTYLDQTWQDAGTFSRATALAGAWSSGTLTVSASPQGNQMTFQLFDLTSQDVSWSGQTGTIKVYANVDGGETKYDTGKRLTVTAPVSPTTLSGSWSSGTLTVSASPQGNSKTFQLFDLTSSDVSWSGRTGTIKVYSNVDGGETKYDTGKRLTVTAPVTPTTLSGSWSSGTLTVSASPQGNSKTFQLFDLTSSDISWNGRTATCKVYANVDGGETKYDTGKRLTVTYAGDPHTVTGFDTTSPSGATYNNLTNNSSGYTTSGSNVYIVVKGTWNCDGIAREGYSYLQGTPTAIANDVSFGSESSSSSEPSGSFAKSYSINKNYTWHWFTVTIAGAVSKRVKMKLIS